MRASLLLLGYGVPVYMMIFMFVVFAMALLRSMAKPKKWLGFYAGSMRTSMIVPVKLCRSRFLL